MVLTSIIVLIVAACSGSSVEPDPLPMPLDTTDPGPTVVPLDGRGGGVFAYALQPGPNSGVHEIYAMNGDGTGNTRLCNANIGLNHHDWSPDAERIAAVGYVEINTWSIHVFDSSGANLVRLTHTSGVLDTEPSWSPDGTSIAFTRIFPSLNHRTELWVMNADGSGQLWIGVEGFAAKWSPDGSRFIFASNYQGDSDILICNVDGTDVQSLLSTTSEESMPVWSPSGDEVAFNSNSDGDQEIYVMNSDGSNLRQLTANNVGDYTPRWSSDGSLIAFGSGLPGNDHWEVYVINADGTNLRRVTHTPEPLTAINPAWRPTQD